MTTFDEKPKAVRTSITVTVNYCYRQQHYNGLLNSVDNTKKKKEPLPCAGHCLLSMPFFPLYLPSIISFALFG